MVLCDPTVCSACRLCALSVVTHTQKQKHDHIHTRQRGPVGTRCVNDSQKLTFKNKEYVVWATPWIVYTADFKEVVPQTSGLLIMVVSPTQPVKYIMMSSLALEELCQRWGTNPGDAIVTSSGLSRFRLADYKFVAESWSYINRGVECERHGCLPDWKGLMTDQGELHSGNCRIQCFCSLTHIRKYKSKYLWSCFDFFF